MKYEVRNKPNNGCGIVVILLIICILFGMLASCTKSELIQPTNKIQKGKKCLDCGIKSQTIIDTVIHK